jgi:thiamine pyrophosphokinase
LRPASQSVLPFCHLDGGLNELPRGKRTCFARPQYQTLSASIKIAERICRWIGNCGLKVRFYRIWFNTITRNRYEIGTAASRGVLNQMQPINPFSHEELNGKLGFSIDICKAMIYCLTMSSILHADFAVIFVGGEAPSQERCRTLAQGANCIAAADSGLIACETAGCTPDFIVGDMDSLEQAGQLRRLNNYPKEKIFRCSHEKDQTDTELALDLLRKQGHERIRLIGGGGGRLDHLFAIRELFERENPPQSWHTFGEDIYYVKESTMIPAIPSTPLSIFPLGNSPWNIRSEGLKWQLEDFDWKRGFFGISNVITAKSFFLHIEEGRFMMIIPVLSPNAMPNPTGICFT